VHDHVGGDRAEGGREEAGLERRPGREDHQPGAPLLPRGDRVASCVVAVARTESGPAYRKCGNTGSVWRVVPGGQVPQTCLKRA
jgi:hypothetical protein